MARNTFWKGYLRLSLVTAAVTVSPATTESGKVRFHVLNRATNNRVESRYIDSVTHKRVAEKDQVKGFPKEDGDYVLIEDDEIEALGLESTRTIDIDTFVKADEIDWIWYDKPHFLAPGDKVGAEAFAVIREAMVREGVVGIARLVIYRRERAVLLAPSGKGMILWTLHYGEEMREPVAELETGSKEAKREATSLEKLFDKDKGSWSASLVQDPVQKRIKSFLKTREKDAAPKKAKSAAKSGPKTSGNVINIMDALKKSLKEEKRST